MINALVHGCVAGPRVQTLHRLQARQQVRKAMLAADGFVVSSRFMADLCVRNGVARERIVVTPPPAEPVYGSVADARKPEMRVLFAGRILPQKGLASLVRALGYIPELQRPVLAIAGEPTPELERVQNLARERHVVLDILGGLSPQEFIHAIDGVRAMVVPSLWAEPFGLVGIEAQARGRPSVAYAVGGIPEWIEGAGIAVRLGDERALGNAIAHVISDEHWSGYANAALHRARTFHPSHHTQALREVLCA